MTSRERILRTLQRQPVDRVPISTYELTGFNPDSFENQAPSYQRLMEKIRKDTDCLYMWSWNPWADAGLWEHRTEIQPDGSEITYSRLRTPRGDLTQTTRTIPNIHTIWTTEHLLKSVEDIDRYLSVLPDLFQIGDQNVADARTSYAQAEDRVGDHGVVMSNGGDTSLYVPELFEFGAFTMMCYQYPDKIQELIAAFTPAMLEYYRITAHEKFGALHRLCGPEYFTPPYLPASFFQEFVVPTATACARILKEGGIFLRLHCHGRVREVLPMIRDIGAQGIDPLEPPPDGDIALEEVKALYGDQMVLFGNTELKVLETAEPKEVRELVRRQMDAAKAGGGYVQMSTASPINEPLSPRTERNYFAWIDAGHEFGAY